MIYPASSIKLPTEVEQLLDQADDAKAAFEKLKPLDDDTVGRIKLAFLPDRVTASLNMEGIIATRRQTLAIMDSMTVSQNAPRAEKEILNALNADEFVFDHIQNEEHLSESFIRQINALIEHEIGESPGDYRTRNVKITEAKFEPPDHSSIHALIRDLVEAYRTDRTSHPILKAAWLHNRFTYIHPFLDGNGRTGRLLQDFALMEGGFFPTGIPTSKRDDYYDALSAADEGDWAEFVELIAQRQLSVISAAKGIASDRKVRANWISALAKRADNKKERSQHKNYLVWSHQMLAVRSAFEDTAKELSDSSDLIFVRHDNYDIIDFSTWRQICELGRAERTWFFSQTFIIDGEKLYRCIFYFKRHWNLPIDPFAHVTDLVSLFITGGKPAEHYDFYRFTDKEVRLREVLRLHEDLYTYYNSSNLVGDVEQWQVNHDQSSLRIVQDFYEDILLKKFGI